MKTKNTVVFLILFAVAEAIAWAAPRPRELTSLGALDYICFRPVKQSPVDAGAGGAIVRSPAPQNWSVDGQATFHSSEATEPVSVCSFADPKISAARQTALETMLTANWVNFIANRCNTP